MRAACSGRLTFGVLYNRADSVLAMLAQYIYKPKKGGEYHEKIWEKTGSCCACSLYGC